MNTIDLPRKSHYCICQISYNAPFCNRNVHTFAHLCHQTMHGGIWEWCIVGFGQQVCCRRLACVIELSCSSLKRLRHSVWRYIQLTVRWQSNSSHLRFNIHAFWSVWISIFSIYMQFTKYITKYALSITLKLVLHNLPLDRFIILPLGHHLSSRLHIFQYQ